MKKEYVKIRTSQINWQARQRTAVTCFRQRFWNKFLWFCRNDREILEKWCWWDLRRAIKPCPRWFEDCSARLRNFARWICAGLGGCSENASSRTCCHSDISWFTEIKGTDHQRLQQKALKRTWMKSNNKNRIIQEGERINRKRKEFDAEKEFATTKRRKSPSCHL